MAKSKRDELPQHIKECTWRQQATISLEDKIKACKRCYALNDKTTAKTDYCRHMQKYGIPYMEVQRS